MIRTAICALAAALVLAPWPAQPSPAGSIVRSAKVPFIYYDLDRFSAAHAAILSGEQALGALTRYTESASPAFRFYAERYDVTPEALASEIEKRPNFYARLTRLKPDLQRQEPIIRAALARLAGLAGGDAHAPIYYLVGSQVAGGTPVELDRSTPPALGIAIAIDMVSIGADVDMSEFPKGTEGRASLSDIPYVAIHEAVHVHQVKAQGGLEQYRSIYRPGPNSSNLAVAVREGCADYLTYLASGLQRGGEQDSYGRAHEQELWKEFQKVMTAPAFSAPGWFAGTNEQFPEWPSQIGYWVGGQMCRRYHETAPDKQQAVRDMFTAYRPADLQKIADAYARKFSH